MANDYRQQIARALGGQAGGGASGTSKEKFRRWDAETARQESPREGMGVADRVLNGDFSAGRNERVLREHIDRQYRRNPRLLEREIDDATGR